MHATSFPLVIALSSLLYFEVREVRAQDYHQSPNGQEFQRLSGEWEWIETDSIPGAPVDTTGALIRVANLEPVTTEDLVNAGIFGAFAPDTLMTDGWQVLYFSPSYDPMAILDALEELDGISEATFLPKVKNLGSPPDVLYWKQFNVRQINCAPAWDITTGDEEVVIAIIDTGVDFNHPDIQPNLWTNSGEIPGNNQDDDGNNFIDDVHGYSFAPAALGPDVCDEIGHGTKVASVAAGATAGPMDPYDPERSLGIAGVAGGWQVDDKKGASIMILKTSAGSATSPYGVFAALGYAKDMGADVVNLSIAFGYYPPFGNPNNVGFNARLQSVLDAGICIVAAAGNDDTSSVVYPANYPGVIAVGGVSGNDVRWRTCTGGDTKDCASSYGQDLSCMAYTYLGTGCNPGTDYSCHCPISCSVSPPMAYPQEDCDYLYEEPLWQFGTGTSFAAPEVAGVAALMLSVNPTLGPAEIQSLVERSARKVSGQTGFNIEYGHGIVDALGAVVAAKYDAEVADASYLTGTTLLPKDEGFSGVYLYKDMFVGPNATVQFRPGTTVYVATAGDYGNQGVTSDLVEIVVQGDLTAEGTDGNPVVFASASDSPEAGDWHGITVKGAGEVSLEWTEIRDGEYGVYRQTPLLEGDPNEGSVVLDHCTIENVSIAGVNDQVGYSSPRASLAVSHSQISLGAGSAGQMGIQVSGSVDVTISDTEIDGDEAGTAGAYGFRLSSATVNGTLTRVKALNFTVGSGFRTSGACTLKAVSAENCKYGIYVDANYPLIQKQGSDRCKLTNCTTGIYVTGYAYPRILEADISTPSGGIGVYTDVGAGGGYSHLNVSGGAIGFKAWSADTDPDYFWLRQSAIRCFSTYGVYASGADIIDLGADYYDQGKNEFFSPASPCSTAAPTKYVAVKTPRLSGLPQIPAVYNYWGTSSPSSTKFSTFVDYVPVLSDSLASVSVIHAQDTPHGSDIKPMTLQAYPNPFSRTLRIHYSSGREASTEVQLQVFDVAGRLVRSLVVETVTSGEHSTTWDGADEYGRQAPSGLYLARLLSGGVTQVVRIAKVW